MPSPSPEETFAAGLEELLSAPGFVPGSTPDYDEPEVMGGCSCGAKFFTYEAADEHECRLEVGRFGGYRGRDDVDGVRW